MKFYLKYILLGVVIGLLILALLTLAGCEDTEAQAEDRFQWDQIQRLKKDVGNNEAAFQVLAKENRTLQARLDNQKSETKSLAEHLAHTDKVYQDFYAEISQIMSDDLSARIIAASVYLSDIDPNAPINTHLLKLSESWVKEYGTSHESVLKYNVVAAWAFAQKALQEIAVLNNPVDPNDVNWLGWPVLGGEYTGIDPGLYMGGPPPDQWTVSSVEIGLTKSGNVVWRKVDPNEAKEPVPISIKALEPKWVDPNEVKK